MLFISTENASLKLPKCVSDFQIPPSVQNIRFHIVLHYFSAHPKPYLAMKDGHEDFYDSEENVSSLKTVLTVHSVYSQSIGSLDTK